MYSLNISRGGASFYAAIRRYWQGGITANARPSQSNPDRLSRCSPVGTADVQAELGAAEPVGRGVGEDNDRASSLLRGDSPLLPGRNYCPMDALICGIISARVTPAYARKGCLTVTSRRMLAFSV